jgi:predicted CopG family antitoxin
VRILRQAVLLASCRKKSDTIIHPTCKSSIFMHDSCMATKTITLELDAYEKLAAAKRGRESFSSVVRRCILPGAPRNGASVLAALRERRRFMSDDALGKLEEIDRSDPPPDNPWEETV